MSLVLCDCLHSLKWEAEKIIGRRSSMGWTWDVQIRAYINFYNREGTTHLPIPCSFYSELSKLVHMLCVFLWFLDLQWLNVCLQMHKIISCTSIDSTVCCHVWPKRNHQTWQLEIPPEVNSWDSFPLPPDWWADGRFWQPFTVSICCQTWNGWDKHG